MLSAVIEMRTQNIKYWHSSLSVANGYPKATHERKRSVALVLGHPYCACLHSRTATTMYSSMGI